MSHNIGLDFDGVIVNKAKLLSFLAEKILNKKLPLELGTRELAIGSKILTEKEYNDLQVLAYNSPEFGILMEPVDDLLTYLPKILDEGHKVKIITSRLETGTQIAKKILKKLKIDLEVIGVSRGSKAPSAKGLDFFVDDGLDKLLDVEKSVKKLFLFSWPYNTNLKIPETITRVNNWKELYDQINKKPTTI